MFLPQLLQRTQNGQKLVALTCYDASFAKLLCENGVDVVLVGDSLGMTVQGHATTLGVTLPQMVYHTEAVARGLAQTNHPVFLIADLPFGSYQASPQAALTSAAQLMAAGANMVKLEGGAVMVETVSFLSQRGIPVCAHLGLLPQSVNHTGYRAQAKEQRAAQQLLEDAAALEAAGASLVVLESIPALLATEVTRALGVPTIGIGAGAGCSGQVLVLNDLLGLTPKPPRFSRDFLAQGGNLASAIRAYAEAVRGGTFPGPEHQF